MLQCGILLTTWGQNDTSPVFYLTKDEENALKNNTYKFKMYVLSEDNKTEKQHTQSIF